MLQKRWFILFLISSFWFTTSAQTLEETIRFARAQEAEGHTALALKSYQRVLFFGGKKYREECQDRLSVLFAAQGDLARAGSYCDLLYQSAGSDSLRYEALFRKTGLLMLQQEHKKALLELLSLPKNLPEPWRSRQKLYLGAAHFGVQEFDAARADLLPLFAAEDSAGRANFEKLMRKAEKAARKSPRTARLLSTFFPGAGQFYAGDIKNGLNSLILNGLLGYYFVVTGINYSFIDAGGAVGPWLFRYYAGGIRRAGEIVEQKKEQRLKKIFGAVLQEIDQ